MSSPTIGSFDELAGFVSTEFGLLANRTNAGLATVQARVAQICQEMREHAVSMGVIVAPINRVTKPMAGPGAAP